MNHYQRNWLQLLAALGTAVGIAMVPMSGTFADENHNPQVLPPNSKPFGTSYSNWSAEWWKWQLYLPATDHPAYSKDGANCRDGQSGKVWFLTGAFTTEFPDNEFVTIIRESCSVPAGKAIFFPIMNVECSTVEAPPYRGENPKELKNCAKSFFDGPNAVAGDLSVRIDGKPVDNVEDYRFQSPVFRFNFKKPKDNILGVDCKVEDCDKARSASDGYWIMLSPLSKGNHTIQFTGSLRDPQTNGLFFGLDVTYQLNVVGDPKKSED